MELTVPKPIIDYKSYKLTSKQAKFIELLVSEPSIAKYQAYMQIFGTKSEASAMSGQSKLMSKSNIQSYKSALEGAAAKKAIESNVITQERILQEEACIAFHDIGGLLDDDGVFIKNLKLLPDEIRRNIASLEIAEKMDPFSGKMEPYYKLKFNDKGRALERLEKHLGMLVERVEIGVEVTLKALIATIDGKKDGRPMIPHLK